MTTPCEDHRSMGYIDPRGQLRCSRCKELVASAAVVFAMPRFQVEAPIPPGIPVTNPDIVASPLPDLGEVLTRLCAKLGTEKERRVLIDDWARYCFWLAEGQAGPGDATQDHIEGFMLEMREAGYVGASCTRALSALRAVYIALVTAGVRKDNPTDGVMPFSSKEE